MAKLEGKAREVMEKAEVVAIATCGEDGVHLVATWGDYVRNLGIQDDEVILIPAGGYRKTEQNLRENPRVELLIASRQVVQAKGAGTGFRLSGRGEVQTSGEWAEMAKLKYSWARGVFVIHVHEVEQLF